jgi:hypothetical protein
MLLIVFPCIELLAKYTASGDLIGSNFFAFFSLLGLESGFVTPSPSLSSNSSPSS